MSTSLSSTLFQSRYKDDFTDSNGFYRIMFNSGRTLQARELTQMQTILQEQIKRFGSNIFKDGAVVKPGERILNTTYEFAKLNVTAFPLPSDTSTLIGTTFTGATSGVTGRLQQAVRAENSDPSTLYFAYTNAPSSQSGPTAVRFLPGENITNGATTLQVQTINTDANPAVGRGTRLDIGGGIYYIQGFFVFTEAQSFLVAKYNDSPSETVGFKVIEDIVSIDDNADLYDNQGAVPNTSAPGADRFRIKLELANQSQVDSNTNFVPNMEIQNGIIIAVVDQESSYNIIRDFVATRIKENSGDYIVKPFYLELGDDSQQGFLTLTLSDGTVVVDGYRANHYAPETFRIAKPTSTFEVNNQLTPANFGNYALVQADSIGNQPGGVTAMKGLPNINTFEKLDLMNGMSYNGDSIGTARLRSVSEDGGNRYRFYLFDIRMNAGQSVRNVQSVGTSVAQYFNPIRPRNKLELKDQDKNVSTFPLPRIRPRSIDDISLTVQRHFQVTTDGAGAASISLSATGEKFVNTNDWVVAPSDSAIITGGLTFASPPEGQTAANFTGLPASTTMKVLGYVNKSVGQVRSKTLVETTKTATVDASGKLNLDKADIFEIVRLRETDSNGRDLINNFKLDNGQRDNYYAQGNIKLKTGLSIPTNPVFVRFKHFNHGTNGDFFAINSYTGQVDYNKIQFFRKSDGTAVNLRNVLDFRSVQDLDSNFATSGTGARVNELPQVNDTITGDVTYFNSRIDTLGIDTEGNVVITPGNEQSVPLRPVSQSTGKVRTLPLYDVFYKANTLDATDVIVKKYDHKRFTMADIGLLEDRVDKLEEIATLSLLETDTKNFKVLDSAGLDRTKSGFFVDNFTTQVFSNTVDKNEYRAAIDPQVGLLRPMGIERNVRMMFDSANSENVIKKGDNVYLTHTEVKYIDQFQATRAVKINPYEAVIYRGDIDLSPSSDEWREIQVDAIKAIDGGTKLDTTQAYLWNNWQWNWGGQDINDLKIGSTTNTKTEGSGSPTISKYTNKVVSDEIVQEVIGQRVLSVALLPFMRSRKIYFRAQGLRPSSTVYAYFNGTEVGNFVREETFERISNDDVDDWTEHKNAVSHPEGATALTTDTFGKVEGSFFVPNNTELKFRTGTRKFQILDVSTFAPHFSTTTAVALYAATGYLDHVEQDIKSTRVLGVEFDKTNSKNPNYHYGGGGGDGHAGGGGGSYSGVFDASTGQPTSFDAYGSFGYENEDHGDPGDGSSGGSAGTHICTATWNLGMIDFDRFKIISKYGMRMRRKDPYMMKGYDIVGPWIAEKVRKHKFMTKLGIDLTKYYQDLMLGKKLSGKQRLIQLASHGLIRPIYRVIGAVAKLMERGKL